MAAQAVAAGCAVLRGGSGADADTLLMLQALLPAPEDSRVDPDSVAVAGGREPFRQRRLELKVEQIGGREGDAVELDGEVVEPGRAVAGEKDPEVDVLRVSRHRELQIVELPVGGTRRAAIAHVVERERSIWSVTT